jgi:hypothetical protein
MNRIFPRCLLVLSALGFAQAAQALESAAYEKTVKPFFQEHCFKCHDERKQKGDLRLDTLPRILSARRLPSIGRTFSEGYLAPLGSLDPGLISC